MSHGGCIGRTVPVLFTRFKPDDIAGADFFAGAAFALRPAKTTGGDDGLAQWMGVPCGAGARFKRDRGPANPCGIGCLKRIIKAYLPGKIIGVSFDGGF